LDSVTISPKKEAIKIDLLKRFISTLSKKRIYFKFVVEKKKDVDFWLKIAKKVGVDKNHIILMPEGTTKKKIRQKSKWLVELCKKHGVRFSTRLQILLCGRKRGV
jgi:organic radical activating enzyme